jgi:hypothetical protein
MQQYVASASIHQLCSHKVICPLTAGSLEVDTGERHLEESESALQLRSHGSSAL